MAPVSENAKRLRTIVIAFPLLVVTTAILYRRTMLGEEQRTVSRKLPTQVEALEQQRLLDQVGGVPWQVQGQKSQEKSRHQDNH